MILGVVLSLIIIGIWLCTGTLAFTFYSSKIYNHFMFRSAFLISYLNLFQAVLGIYYIITGDGQYQMSRWTTFSLIEVTMLSFLIRGTKKRQFELIITSVFMTLILLSISYPWLIFNLLICAILSTIAYRSEEQIIKKWFTPTMIMYGMTFVVPSIFGLTTNESLGVGVIFSLMFMLGVSKLYNKEKTDDKLKEMIKNGEL